MGMASGCGYQEVCVCVCVCVWLVGVVTRRCVCEASGWNLWVWLLGGGCS